MSLFGAVLQFAVLEVFQGPIVIAPTAAVNSASAANAPTVGTDGKVLLTTAINSASASAAPTVRTGVAIIPAASINSGSIANAPTASASNVQIRDPVNSGSAAGAPIVLGGAGVIIKVGVKTVTDDIGSVLDASVADVAVFGGPTFTRSATLIVNSASNSNVPSIAAGVNIILFVPVNSKSLTNDLENRRRRVLMAIAS